MVLVSDSFLEVTRECLRVLQVILSGMASIGKKELAETVEAGDDLVAFRFQGLLYSVDALGIMSSSRCENRCCTTIARLQVIQEP